MRFRLATGGLTEGANNAVSRLFQLPLYEAQAREDALNSSMKRDLMSSQIAENVSQAAIRDQERQQLEGRPYALKLMGATRAGMSVPDFEIGLRERINGAPVVGPTFLNNREPQFNDAITTLYGPALATPAGKTNWDQLASARDRYQTQDVLDQVLQGQLNPGRAGAAVAASKGTKQVENIGNTGTGFNIHTGEGAVLDEAMRALFGQQGTALVKQRNAAAGASGASASLANARRERVAGGYDKPVTILDDDTGDATITRVPTGAEPVTVGVAPKKATGKDATNAKERNRVVRDVEKEMVGASEAEIAAEVERRMNRRSAAPAPKPAASPPAPALDMGKAADIKAKVKAGALTREQGVAQLRALGFK
jgi:hypothetical protein